MSDDGRKNVVTGMAKNNEMKTCEVCNKTMGKRAFKQYGHGPNCSHKQCEHCGVWEAKTKYDKSHGDKCKHNPNRTKPFVSKPKKKKVI
jgi:urate oxidase